MSLRATTTRLRFIDAPERAPVSAPAAVAVAPRRRRTDVRVAPPAPAFSPTDARWVLASRVRDALEGGAAGVLRPESRSRLLDLGRRLGLRPFDINLIIAIVQDHVRCAGSEPRSEMLRRLAVIPGAPHQVERLAREDGRAWWFAWIGASLVLAGAFMLAGMVWLTG